MWCKKCSQYSVNTKWNINREYMNKKTQAMEKGIQRFKIDSIRYHALSDSHRGAKSNEKQSNNLMNMWASMIEKSHSELKRLISIVIFLCQEKLAYSKYPSLCKLTKSFGVKLTDEDLYISRYGCLEIIKAISECIWKRQVFKVKQARHFSLIIDESSDLVSQKELIIYVKYFDIGSSKVVTQFLKLIKLESFTAFGIVKEIQSKKILLMFL